jgi:hypothetical protein
MSTSVLVVCVSIVVVGGVLAAALFLHVNPRRPS